MTGKYLKFLKDSHETITIPSLSEKKKMVGVLYKSKVAVPREQLHLLCLL